MKLQKRLFAIILLLGLVFQSSCGFIVFNNEADTETNQNDSGEASTSDSTSNDSMAPNKESDDPVPLSTIARERLKELPQRDFNEAPIIIATTDQQTILPTDSDDHMNSAKIDSRRAVEEAYNTVIISNPVSAATMLEDAKKAVLAETYYADLLAIPLSEVGAFRASGILANMNSLPHTDYSAEYYNQTIIESAYAGNQLYAVFGDANFNPSHLSAVYFNRELIKECGVDDIYTLVSEGKWTWDKLREFAINACSGVDSISGIGAAYDKSTLIDIAATSHGIVYTSSSINAVPAVDYLDNDSIDNKAKAAVDSLYNLIYKDKTFVDKKADDVQSIFLSGELLFCIDSLDYIDSNADSDVSWGLLPIPKYDDQQESYLTLLSNDAPVFCAIAGTSSYENAGIILEALNVASHDYVVETYLNERMNYYLRDSGSISMLSIICESAVSDFSHLFSSGFSHLSKATYNAVQNAVTTRSSLDSLYKSYKIYADRELSGSIKLGN